MAHGASRSILIAGLATARTQLRESVFLAFHTQTNSFPCLQAVVMILSSVLEFPTYSVNFTCECMNISETRVILLRKRRLAIMSMAACRRNPISVTALVHCLAQDFNADDSVSEMMASSRRPRPEYARDVNGLLYPRHLFFSTAAACRATAASFDCLLVFFESTRCLWRLFAQSGVSSPRKNSWQGALISWPNARRAKSFSLIGKEPSSFVRSTESLGEHETSTITFTRQRWNSLSLAAELVQVHDRKILRSKAARRACCLPAFQG